MSSWIREIEKITREGDRDQLLTSRQAAKLLQVTPQTVENWGRGGKLKRVVLSSRAVRFKLSDVRELIRERTER